MTLVLAQLRELMVHALNGAEPTHAAAWIANMAGEDLCSAHAWKWLEPEDVPLNLLAGVGHVYLPEGTASVSQVVVAGGTGLAAAVTAQDVTAIREGFFPPPSGPVVWYATSTDEDGNLRLEVAPIPTTSSLGTLVATIRRGWVELVDDQSRARIPRWLEPLYVEWLLEYVRGLYREADGTWTARRDRLLGSQTFRQYQKRDGGVQVDLGEQSGGAAQLAALPADEIPTWTLPVV